MNEFSFKKITFENWLDADPVLNAFSKFTPEGPQPITSEDLIKDILTHQLNETVPHEVKELFEVARGAMCYGYFFYPLYTFSSEQLFRVAETSVNLICKSLNAPGKVKSFSDKVEYLIEKSIIPENEKLRWEGIRGLRNLSSHPQRQSIIPPSTALNNLRQMAVLINKLFTHSY